MRLDNPTQDIHPLGSLWEAFLWGSIATALALGCAPRPASFASNSPRVDGKDAATLPSVPPRQNVDTASPWLVTADPDLRRLTVAIRVPTPPPLAEAYAKLARSLKSYSSILLAHAEGGFGSGFILVRRPISPAGPPRIYVVTNRHVVGLAEDAEIFFDGSSSGSAARVVHVDEGYDLALLELAFPDPPPIESGLALATTPVQDQDVVTAVGFPGIGGHPSYQITQGYVSNRSVTLPLDGKTTPHIQHTAAIDPGSSGGPLLSDDKRVVGINTLKLFGRDGVGFAVPATAIESAFEVLLSDARVSSDNFQEACNRFVSELSGDEGLELAALSISARLAAEQGIESLSFLPEEKEDWPEIFSLAPDDLLVYAIALRVRATLTQVEQSNLVCRPSSEDPERTFEVVTHRSKVRLTFTREQNRPKVDRISLPRNLSPNFLIPPRKKKWKPSL